MPQITWLKNKILNMDSKNYFSKTSVKNLIKNIKTDKDGSAQKITTYSPLIFPKFFYYYQIIIPIIHYTINNHVFIHQFYNSRIYPSTPHAYSNHTILHLKIHTQVLINLTGLNAIIFAGSIIYTNRILHINILYYWSYFPFWYFRTQVNNK